MTTRYRTDPIAAGEDEQATLNRINAALKNIAPPTTHPSNLSCPTAKKPNSRLRFYN